MGILTGDATFVASPATVDEATLEETGYDLHSAKEYNLTKNVSAGGEERTVTVTNHVREYKRNLADLPGDADLPADKTEIARVAVLSTPAIEVLGNTFNPVEEWSEARIARELSAEYDRIEDVEHTGNRSVESLGEQRTVARFTAEATLVGGATVDVAVHVTKFRHGDDFVVAVAVHPQLVDERDRVDAMFGGLSH